MRSLPPLLSRVYVRLPEYRDDLGDLFLAVVREYEPEPPEGGPPWLVVDVCGNGMPDGLSVSLDAIMDGAEEKNAHA